MEDWQHMHLISEWASLLSKEKESIIIRVVRHVVSVDLYNKHYLVILSDGNVTLHLAE